MHRVAGTAHCTISCVPHLGGALHEPAHQLGHLRYQVCDLTIAGCPARHPTARTTVLSAAPLCLMPGLQQATSHMTGTCCPQCPSVYPSYCKLCDRCPSAGVMAHGWLLTFLCALHVTRSCVFPCISILWLLMTACRDPGILPRQEADEEWLAGRKPRCDPWNTIACCAFCTCLGVLHGRAQAKGRA